MMPMTCRTLSVLATLGCVIALGCREKPAQAPAPTSSGVAVPAMTVDEQVLAVLDYYEPMYKVDANGRVTHLRLSGRHLPSAIMAEVGKLTELQGLELYGTTVTDEGLAQLKDLQQLRSMGLGATLMTDQGLVHLENLQSLQWVWVPKLNVTSAAIEKLKTNRPDMNVNLQ